MTLRVRIPAVGRVFLAILLLACTVSCRSPRTPPASDGRTPGASEPTPPPRTAPTSSRPRVVVLGDSLTAGLGLDRSEAYPALLQQKMDAAGYAFEVVNAGVSGDTTAGGLSRLDWSLQGDVRVLVVALGGNDGLRGLPPKEVEQNLERIIDRAKARGIAVLLAGMESPTNMGSDYQRRFHDIFPTLARRRQVAFLPFLLDGVAGRPELNQRDGIHPTRQGAQIIADHLWAVLEPMLRAQAVPR